jgi:hypothetical protein
LQTADSNKNRQYRCKPHKQVLKKLARLFHIEQYNPIYPVLSSVFAEELVNHPG